MNTELRGSLHDIFSSNVGDQHVHPHAGISYRLPQHLQKTQWCHSIAWLACMLLAQDLLISGLQLWRLELRGSVL